MASEAEARIRTKAEALLRSLFPDGRIIHEFELRGVRLDLASVTPDRLILLEIKSELDTLSRLEKQARYGLSVGGPVLVCFAPKWKDAIREMGIYRTISLEETADGFTSLHPATISDRHDRYDSRVLLTLLLKAELLALARPYGGKTSHTVPVLHNLAHEHLTGREIRRGVMAALRSRHFGWTCDEPISEAA